MISYHPANTRSETAVQRGWKTADTLDVKRIADGISRYAWSPCVWKDGDKRIANFLRADFLVLDFDTPELPLAQALNVFCDYIHVIGTTKSHQKDKGGVVCDRYRVVIRMGERVTDAKVYRASLAHAMKHFPADPACKDAGRFFWPCTEIISVNDDGFTADVMEPEPEPEKAEGVLSSFDRAGCMPRSATQLGYDHILTDRHRTVFLCGLDLGRAGYSLAVGLDLLRKGPTWALKERRKEFERTLKDGHAQGVREREEDKKLFMWAENDERPR